MTALLCFHFVNALGEGYVIITGRTVWM